MLVLIIEKVQTHVAVGVQQAMERLDQMERQVESMNSNSSEAQVQDCLRHVRILAARPNMMQPHVLLAAIETLVGVAVKESHKDADYYSKAYIHCKKFEEAKDLSGLTMKLLGSAEDKKIANVVADWAKSNKYEDAPSHNNDSSCSCNTCNTYEHGIKTAHGYGGGGGISFLFAGWK